MRVVDLATGEGARHHRDSLRQRSSCGPRPSRLCTPAAFGSLGFLFFVRRLAFSKYMNRDDRHDDNYAQKSEFEHDARSFAWPSFAQLAALVRFAASKVMTSLRRIVAIRPRTRKRLTTKGDRIEIRSVCNISTSSNTTRSRSITSATVFDDAPAARTLPERLAIREENDMAAIDRIKPSAA
jgi:hypothetical protein